jgi:hypothetical protein
MRRRRWRRASSILTGGEQDPRDVGQRQAVHAAVAVGLEAGERGVLEREALLEAAGLADPAAEVVAGDGAEVLEADLAAAADRAAQAVLAALEHPSSSAKKAAPPAISSDARTLPTRSNAVAAASISS